MKFAKSVWSPVSSLCVRPVHRFQITGSPKREDYRSVFAIYRCPTCLFRRSQSRGHPCASPRAARTGDRAYRFWAGFPGPHPGVTPIQCPGKSLAGTGFDRIRWLGIDTFEVRGVMRRPGRLSQERSRPPDSSSARLENKYNASGTEIHTGEVAWPGQRRRIQGLIPDVKLPHPGGWGLRTAKRD